MNPSTTIAILPVVYEPEPADLSPPVMDDRSDELSDYVASSLSDGRPLFDVLADPFVQERADEYVSVLDHLAREPAVRASLERQRGGASTAVLRLAA